MCDMRSRRLARTNRSATVLTIAASSPCSTVPTSAPATPAPRGATVPSAQVTPYTYTDVWEAVVAIRHRLSFPENASLAPSKNPFDFSLCCGARVSLSEPPSRSSFSPAASVWVRSRRLTASAKRR